MHANKQVGFSLLEVLLAIGLVGVALPAVITLWISQVASFDTSTNMVKLINAKKSFCAIRAGASLESTEPTSLFMTQRLESSAAGDIYKTFLTTNSSCLTLPSDDEVFFISCAKDAAHSLDGVFNMYDCTIKLSARDPSHPTKARAGSPKCTFTSFCYSKAEM